MLTGPVNICNSYIDMCNTLTYSQSSLGVHVDSQSIWTPNECWLGVNIPNSSYRSECLSYRSECHQLIRNQSYLYVVHSHRPFNRPFTSSFKAIFGLGYFWRKVCFFSGGSRYVKMLLDQSTFAGMTAQYTVSVGFCSWTTQFKDARIAGLW
jgi:hypothetical protein